MATVPDGFEDSDGGRMQDDLRQQISAVLTERGDLVAADTIAIFPFSGAERVDPDYCTRVGQMLVQLLSFAVRDGGADGLGGLVEDLYRMVLERGLSIRRLFVFFYLTERTAIDELALDEEIGATSEPWPVVAQLVRRASFDVLAAFTVRAQLEPTGAAIIDQLTTLHTRPLLDTVLLKEADRAGRLGHPLSFILFDVDHLSEINQEHGYGVGDKLLERLGILIRAFFRQHDWVARYSEDSFAVLLTGADADHAKGLAERVRSTVEGRLEFTDHRTDLPVRITLSGAVLNYRPKPGDLIDPERVLTEAEAALDRAKRFGRNRIEHVDAATSGARPAST
jgi:diguanylate cyclase (GGDEF)-like protein